MVTNIGYKNTDIGVIPKDWDCIHLCTLGKLLSGLTYTPEDVKNYGLLVLRSSNIQEGRLCFKDNVYVNCKIEADKYVKQGDLLICVRNGSRALIGKCALIDKNYNATFGAFMALFRSPHGKYLYQLFSNNTIQEQINRNCGATINQITSADFNRFLVAFPQNPKEQAAISEALSDVDNLTSSLQKLIEKKKAIKQGAMQELLTGKKRLPGFSGEWSNLRIEEIANLHDNLRVPVEKSMREKGNIPYYGANGIQDYVNGYTHNGSYVLIAEDGANDLQEYPIRYASGKMWVNNHVHVLDGKNSVSDTRFLSYSMSTIDYQAAITGGTRAKLNGHILMQLALDLPPLAEQQAIAQVLSDMDSEIEQLKKKLSKYQQIKQGMMQELLTGRIRITNY